MKFALVTGMTGTTWDDVLALWRHGDQTGWDAACVTDHLLARLEATGVGMLLVPTFLLPPIGVPPSFGSCRRSRPRSADLSVAVARDGAGDTLPGTRGVAARVPSR